MNGTGNGSIIINGSSEELKYLSQLQDPQTAMTSVFVYLNKCATLDEALSLFYKYGNSVPELFGSMDLNEILKDIYNNHDETLNEKIKGAIGLKNQTTYSVDFLINKLPKLSESGEISRRLIDDAIRPNGLIWLLMKEIYAHHDRTLDMINKTFDFQANAPGSNKEETDKQKQNVIAEFKAEFDTNNEAISKIFSHSDMSFIYNTLFGLAKKIEEGEEFAPAEKKQETSYQGPVSSFDNTEVFKAIMEKIASVSSENQDAFASLHEAIANLKEFMSSKREVSSDTQDQPTSPKEFDGNLKEMLGDLVVTLKSDIFESGKATTSELTEVFSNSLQAISENLFNIAEKLESKKEPSEAGQIHRETSESYPERADIETLAKQVEALTLAFKENFNSHPQTEASGNIISLEEISEKLDAIATMIGQKAEAEFSGTPSAQTADTKEIEALFEKRFNALEAKIDRMLSMIEGEINESRQLRANFLSDNGGGQSGTGDMPDFDKHSTSEQKPSI